MINIILSYLNLFKLDEFKSRIGYDAAGRMNIRHESKTFWTPYNFRELNSFYSIYVHNKDNYQESKLRNNYSYYFLK